MNRTTEPNSTRRKEHHPRRLFSIGEQLQGKLGRRAYDELVAALKRGTRRAR